MYLPEEKALMVLQLLVEGNSIRSITRITGVEKKTRFDESQDAQGESQRPTAR
jgi:hypothetical protein